MRPRGVPQTSPALHQRLTSQPRPVAPGPAAILALAAHQRPRASLALARPLSLPPPEASSLDWTPQKQNHKPISVTLPMRLDGSDLSPLGGGGTRVTPVSHRGALSATQSGSLLLADNSGWILAGHVTPLLRFGATTAGSARACRARRRRGGSEERGRHVFSALKMEIPYDEGKRKAHGRSGCVGDSLTNSLWC